MKKLFIGLLVVAAGTGVFFLLNKKKNTEAITSLNKELIIGKWKTDAVIANDSAFNKLHYNFEKEGLLIISDSTEADSTHYEWSKTNDLVWKDKATDSSGKTYAVLKLTHDSLRVQSKDSTIILFTKVK